jgi:hypothetical protein
MPAAAATPDTAPANISPAPTVAPENPVLTALRAILEGRLPDARQCLQALDEDNRDLLLGLLHLAALLGQQKGINAANPRELSVLVQEIDKLGAVLRPWVPLVLPRACFCRRVENFGVYDPLPENRYAFQAGVDGKPGELVLLYVEVRNFASRTRGQKPDEVYEMVLSGTLEIREKNLFPLPAAGPAVPGAPDHADGPGRPASRPRGTVWKRDFPAKFERTLALRQDYFTSFFFHIPHDVPPGHYTLLIEVRDQVCPVGIDGKARVAHKSLDFDVVENRSYLGANH